MMDQNGDICRCDCHITWLGIHKESKCYCSCNSGKKIDQKMNDNLLEFLNATNAHHVMQIDENRHISRRVDELEEDFYKEMSILKLRLSVLEDLVTILAQKVNVSNGTQDEKKVPSCS